MSCNGIRAQNTLNLETKGKLSILEDKERFVIYSPLAKIIYGVRETN